MSLSRFLLRQLLLHTDASLLGWGAHLLDLTDSGVWSQEESYLHVNVLKMKAIVLALAAFLPQLWQKLGLSVPVVKGYRAALNHVLSSTGMDLTAIVKFTQLCSKFPPTALLNFACDG